MTNSNSPHQPDIRKSECQLRLSAYYYQFEKTGVRSVDLMLQAVAMAGKAHHHTDEWSDLNKDTGISQEMLIQRAASNAAIDWHTNHNQAIEKIKAEQTRLEVALDNAFKHNASQKTIDACEYKIVGLMFALEAMEGE